MLNKILGTLILLLPALNALRIIHYDSGRTLQGVEVPIMLVGLVELALLCIASFVLLILFLIRLFEYDKPFYTKAFWKDFPR